MALLQQLNGSCGGVDWSVRGSYSGDGQFDTEVVGLTGLTADRNALLTMAKALKDLCAPAHESREHEAQIVTEVTKTMAVTAGRQREGVDDDVAIDTFVDELSRFPVDCVVRALGAWRRNEKWRPSLADIMLDVEWRAKPRRAALDAVFARLDEAA